MWSGLILPQTLPVMFQRHVGRKSEIILIVCPQKWGWTISRKNHRPRAELIELLKHHRQALAASCTSYDSGNEWEAARLATTVFTLVHDGGSIISLLTRLGLRASLKFISSSHEINPKNLLADTPLIMMKMTTGQHANYLPTLGDVPFSTGPIQFPKWWEKELIYRDGNGLCKAKNRSYLVLPGGRKSSPTHIWGCSRHYAASGMGSYRNIEGCWGRSCMVIIAVPGGSGPDLL